MAKNKKPSVGSSDKEEKDHSPYSIKDHNKIDFELNIRENIPWTDKQKRFFDLFFDKETKLLLICGPAGSSKSLVSIYCALHMIKEHKIDRLSYVRSAVESADTKLLALPGGIEEKMFPFYIPLKEKLEELLPENQVKTLLNGKHVEGIPISYLRGRNFSANKIIIGDEIQNFTYSECISLMTRISEFSKMVLIFDPKQSDLPQNKQGGIEKIWNAFSDQESYDNGIRTFEFGPEDIVRSKLVKYIVEKLEIYNKNKIIKQNPMFPSE